MRVLIATDAWHPQVNGVVRSLEALVREAPRLGAHIDVLSPQGYRTVALPGYAEIRLAVAPMLWPRIVARRIRELDPDYIHIATEGPIGRAVRGWCLKHSRAFTTSYHTKFPEYLAARLPVNERWAYAWLRRFHNAGAGVMVATDSLEQDLAARGFLNIMRWGRGVDAALFRPRDERVLDLPRPIHLYVGRVAVEKNLPAFLGLDLPGSKVVVGDGPSRAELARQFPQAHFLGKRTGEALAEIYASADVFVFPSLTDTFGIVLLEALACGTPVAAFPVTGPKDVVRDGVTGVLSDDLAEACRRALTLSREACRAQAFELSWEAAARQFLANVREANIVRPRRRRLPFRLRRRRRSGEASAASLS
jgi:glycosyltransferase involved in cell wall biosynthesis